MREPGTLDERLTATYVRALNDDVFVHYKPKLSPYPPSGWREDYEKYKKLEDDIKSKGWKKLCDTYQGFMKKKNAIDEENASNLHFLKQMMDHFIKLGMPVQTQKCQNTINEF